MKEFQRITILLKESEDDADYNKRILEYLNDRHRELNNVGFAIAIEVVDDGNINTYIKNGITSTPALLIDNNIEYGVSSILATLAKLEISAPKSINSFSNAPDEDEIANIHQAKMLEEMRSNAPDDENSQSTVRAKHQDFSEAPMSEREREARMSKYDSVYKDRMKNNPANRHNKSGPVAPAAVPSAKKNVDKLIESKGYDKAEAAFMREIAKNLD